MLVKKLSGDMPLTGLLEKAQALHYPPGCGKITVHSDPYAFQTMNFGVPLTKRGQDYVVGGTFAINSSKEKVGIEEHVSPGDAYLFFPSLWHGVDTIDPGLKADWNDVRGRWYLAGFTVQPHGVTNRLTALGAELDL